MAAAVYEMEICIAHIGRSKKKLMIIPFVSCCVFLSQTKKLTLFVKHVIEFFFF